METVAKSTDYESGLQTAQIKITNNPLRSSAVIVAHPDDETLWSGGLILSNPDTDWFITALCRGNDPDRSPKFLKAVDRYRATGAIADLDDEPEQDPLPGELVQRSILGLVPNMPYERIITHAPWGEYTRHRRHEEVSQAVIELWNRGTISANEVWLYAYNDSDGEDLPRAVEGAHHHYPLPQSIWQEKYRIITEIYGFLPESWEARVTPQIEAFWRFTSSDSLLIWQQEYGSQY